MYRTDKHPPSAQPTPHYAPANLAVTRAKGKRERVKRGKDCCTANEGAALHTRSPSNAVLTFPEGKKKKGKRTTKVSETASAQKKYTNTTKQGFPFLFLVPSLWFFVHISAKREAGRKREEMWEKSNLLLAGSRSEWKGVAPFPIHTAQVAPRNMEGERLFFFLSFEDSEFQKAPPHNLSLLTFFST